MIGDNSIIFLLTKIFLSFILIKEKRESFGGLDKMSQEELSQEISIKVNPLGDVVVGCKETEGASSYEVCMHTTPNDKILVCRIGHAVMALPVNDEQSTVF